MNNFTQNNTVQQAVGLFRVSAAGRYAWPTTMAVKTDNKDPLLTYRQKVTSMFRLFKKKENNQQPKPKLEDINHQPLKVGDKVESLRYNMGLCEIQLDENDQVIYFSLVNGKKVSWLKMIDAATECQKVKKVEASL